jgi:hypothetical protein
LGGSSTAISAAGLATSAAGLATGSTVNSSGFIILLLGSELSASHAEILQTLRRWKCKRWSLPFGNAFVTRNINTHAFLLTKAKNERGSFSCRLNRQRPC